MRQGRDLQELEAHRLDVRFWHKADMSGSGLVPCKLAPVPHSTGR
jgi:hypothetical protein